MHLLSKLGDGLGGVGERSARPTEAPAKSKKNANALTVPTCLELTT